MQLEDTQPPVFAAIPPPAHQLMGQQRSFLPSDFSLRDVPGLVAAFVLLSAACVATGLLLERLPPPWAGVLCGTVLALSAAARWLWRGRQVDVLSLPEPSPRVQRMCAAPACRYPSPAFTQAVKVYRDETGTRLTEATAVLRAWIGARDAGRHDSEG